MSNKFSIQKSISTKTINIKLIGKFDLSDAESFLESYKKETSNINTNEYTLNFDCKEMSVTPPGPLLKECFELYKKDGFKKVLANIEKSQIVLGMQFKRLAKEANLSTFEVNIL